MCLRPSGLRGSTRLTTPTFIPPSAINMIGYRLLASPTLHAGQALRAAVQLSDDTTGPVEARLIVAHYTGKDELDWLRGPAETLEPGGRVELELAGAGDRRPADRGGRHRGVGSRQRAPSTSIGCRGQGRRTVRLGRPLDGGTMWRRAWIEAVDVWEARKPETYRFSQNRGTGLISQGSLDWTDYRVDADMTPWMAAAAGVAARVQGLRRYYALQLTGDGRARVVRANDEVDGPCGSRLRGGELPDI